MSEGTIGTNLSVKPPRLSSIMGRLSASEFSMDSPIDAKKAMKIDEVEKKQYEFFDVPTGIQYAPVLCEMAFCYEKGIGMQKNEKKAVSLYKQAVQQHHTKSQYRLGLCYRKGIGTAKDTEKAIELYEKAAKQKYSDAYVELGRHYENGFGVTKDYKMASSYYKKAADQSNARAQCHLAYLYHKGLGVKQNAKKAFAYYRKSADANNARAQNNLGRCYQKGIGIKRNEKKAVINFQKAAEQGNPLAQCNLGLCFMKGEGVKKDIKRAVNLYKMAVGQKSSAAMCHLGFCYMKGLGVEKDSKVAVDLFAGAAEKKNPLGLCYMGICYQKGIGVNKDFKKAIEFYELAANRGQMCAEFNLGLCYLRGYGVKKDEKVAAEYFQHSSDKNFAMAQCHLGYLYENGIGVAQNVYTAIKLYKKAADQNLLLAKKNLIYCYRKEMYGKSPKQKGNGTRRSPRSTRHVRESKRKHKLRMSGTEAILGRLMKEIDEEENKHRVLGRVSLAVPTGTASNSPSASVLSVSARSSISVSNHSRENSGIDDITMGAILTETVSAPIDKVSVLESFRIDFESEDADMVSLQQLLRHFKTLHILHTNIMKDTKNSDEKTSDFLAAYVSKIEGFMHIIANAAKYPQKKTLQSTLWTIKGSNPRTFAGVKQSGDSIKSHQTTYKIVDHFPGNNSILKLEVEKTPHPTTDQKPTEKTKPVFHRNEKKFIAKVQSLSAQSTANELAALRRLRNRIHRNISRFVEKCHEKTLLYTIFESAELTLAEFHAYFKHNVAEDKVIIGNSIIKGVFNGLAFLHDQYLFHLDINPNTVLISRRARAMIFNFNASSLVKLTTSAHIKKDVLSHFDAPEMHVDSQMTLDCDKMDVFSAGMLWAYTCVHSGVDEGKGAWEAPELFYSCIDSSAPNRPTANFASKAITKLTRQRRENNGNIDHSPRAILPEMLPIELASSPKTYKRKDSKLEMAIMPF